MHEAMGGANRDAGARPEESNPFHAQPIRSGWRRPITSWLSPSLFLISASRKQPFGKLHTSGEIRDAIANVERQ